MTDYLPTYTDLGAGPVVLWLHGLGGNRHSFAPQIEVLANRYRCISCDAPGYGGSPAISSMSWPVLTNSLTHLLHKLDVTPYAIVGHSFGGMIAQAWLTSGGSCNKLVLAQTTSRFGKPGSDWNRDFLAARLAPLDRGQAPADFAKALITNLFHNKGNTGGIEAAIATMAPLPAAVYRQVIECLVTFDASDKLHKLDMPTLCLAAEYDTTAPAKTVAQMAQRLPNARYHCMPGTGHLAYVETPELFTHAIADFLDE